jgi:hypothetical protein
VDRWSVTKYMIAPVIPQRMTADRIDEIQTVQNLSPPFFLCIVSDGVSWLLFSYIDAS